MVVCLSLKSKATLNQGLCQDRGLAHFLWPDGRRLLALLRLVPRMLLEDLESKILVRHAYTHRSTHGAVSISNKYEASQAVGAALTDIVPGGPWAGSYSWSSKFRVKSMAALQLY